MTGVEIASALISLCSLALLISNYKRIRERVLKVHIEAPLQKDDRTIGAIFVFENLSDYCIPHVKINLQGFKGELRIFDANQKVDLDPHDSLAVPLDLSKKLHAQGISSIEEMKTEFVRISIECSYYQIILWNRPLFLQKINRKYIWDNDVKNWRHPYAIEWPASNETSEVK